MLKYGLKSVKKQGVHFLTKTNFLFPHFISWLNPLFRIGYKRKLEEDDMYKVLPEDGSERLGEQLQRYWDHEVQKAAKELRDPSLSKVIIKCYWKSYAVLGIFTLIEEVIKVVQPVFLGKLIQYFENYNPNNTEALNVAFGYAAGISMSSIGLALLHHLYFYHVQRSGMKIRVAMCHMIYKKALCLSSTAMGQTTTGQIVNLLSNDVNRFDEVTIFLHFLWVGPLQAGAVIGLLWYEIGPSCLAGMAVLMFLMPLQTLFGRLFSSFRSKTAAFTDSRIRTMNEVVSGIRIIKMYAWEKSFSTLVNEVRRKEISKIMKSSYLRGLNMASFFVASKIIVFITFLVYVMLGNVISAGRVFVAVSLYSAVRLTVTLFFPSAVEKVSEAKISVRRIKKFLLLDEIMKHSSGQPVQPTEEPMVEHILRSEQLLAVIGPVGAGKSSLLSSILGELPQEKGVVKVKGNLTYVCQQPWVFPGTIRSNILFGKELNQQKYERVLKACALKRDMELLPDGDLTVIGDRGATLSGGQKARVNLARAVYQDADIYLLDDPLSAVDAEVGRHLFEQCICGLLRKKPRILVTHQLQYLKAAHQILVLKEGQAVAQGTYTELQRSGLDFTLLLKKEEEDEAPEPAPGVPCRVSRSRTLSQTSVQSHASSVHSAKDGADQLPVGQVTCIILLSCALPETRSTGTIGISLYLKYFRAGANILVLLTLILLNLLAQVVKAKGSLTVATIIFGFLRSLLFFNVLVNSAQTLHNRMFTSILRTPVRFFDINPVGRILNRFSKDIGQLDSMLPWTFVDFIQVFLQILGVIAVAASVIPWILIPVIPLLIVFLVLRRYFLQTSRDIKRLESTTRSPVFSHLSSSLQGLWTIRAFKAEQRFQQTFDAHQDLHSEAWFLFLTTSRWFAVRLDGICAIFVSITAFACLLLRDGTVQLSCFVEYTELESEAPWETEKKPPPDWPRHGNITFDQVNFAYNSDGPVVLKSMNAVFRSKEKVGIVGRTGAGKSSLISALFRLAEPEGTILIDGMKTSEIGLHDLRQKMSIIPQDPVLFTGTMRKNLDPFNQHTDEDLWNVLDEVQLKAVVEELPNKMETELAESGSNFSVGQRQLVCLARAILRKNCILIIDEATANVDPRTDELIQKTIRAKFKECTVLTIAHRLNTIIDSDRILVLDAGRIHEYDEPYVLLQIQDGLLYKMVQQMGKAEAASLLQTAKMVTICMQT
uniref:Multidrug resistance-associated protein 4 n=1 Tax=Scleropages formosus TaxID=113540 RepID=A0A8C9WP25_SCLFO